MNDRFGQDLDVEDEIVDLILDIKRDGAKKITEL